MLFVETNELKPCQSKPDEDGCYFFFIYDYETLTLQTLREKSAKYIASFHSYAFMVLL